MRSRKRPAIQELLEVMARLRGPGGCPWDRKQTHRTLRMCAVEEVYELLDAIESGDDEALLEELGDVLLQVVFHAQLARERGAFDFDAVARRITEKLIHRHPHVFGEAAVRDAEEVLARWDELKREEKRQRGRTPDSVFDGIPRHLPALLRATELIKKARKAGLLPDAEPETEHVEAPASADRWTPRRLARQLWALVEVAQAHGWSAEALLRDESRRRETLWRRREHATASRNTSKPSNPRAVGQPPPLPATTGRASSQSPAARGSRRKPGSTT